MSLEVKATDRVATSHTCTPSAVLVLAGASLGSAEKRGQALPSAAQR